MVQQSGIRRELWGKTGYHQSDGVIVRGTALPTYLASKSAFKPRRFEGMQPTYTHTDMEFLLINDGRIVKAKNKVEALRSSGYDFIYWEGNTPYGVEYPASKRKAYAIRKPKNAIWK